ncbi:TPA: hypothetical protein N0F65_011123 [Lagenidium giganteum]|uniref:Uncharacterized protein n=1 Tax=Lagenidium giganteum TaxID=4803 RepID=A0AAV2ZFE8_9STRA|nr:TPA: hypothetical protein N0F65_011123 [Lagenidium giganteum]
MDDNVRRALPARAVIHAWSTSRHNLELDEPFQLRRPEHDIDQWVPFSWVRCVFSLVSLVLLVSDVPRSGLKTINFSDLFPTVAPDTVINYGPFNYNVVQLVNQSGDVVAVANGTTVDTVSLWPYQYDTLSIPFRALAQHLNVSQCPTCVLYDRACPNRSLTSSMALQVVDSVLDATQQAYFDTKEQRRVPLEFFTVSKWVDRLHHVLYQWIGVVYKDRHKHYVQYLDTTETLQLDLCQTAGTRRGRGRRPRIPIFCSLMVPWQLPHPLSAARSSSGRYRVWEHVAIRLSMLRASYPGLEFDVTTLFTHFAYTSSPMMQGIRAPFQAYFSSEQQSLTDWIRGRQCRNATPANNPCKTILLDDYRYERMVTEHNPNELYLLSATLRCLAQGYVWLRVLLLWSGCFYARSVERQYQSAGLCERVAVAWWTFFRIPAHIVTYGSWLPVFAYAFAHYIDCDVFHVLYYCLWSNSNCDDHFNLYNYLHFMVVQMRNVWVAGAFVLLLSVLQVTLLQPRHVRTLHTQGLLGVRGYVISVTSALTVFAQLPSKSFRDSRVIGIEIVPRVPFGYQPRMPRSSETPTEFGFRYELSILAASLAVIMSLACAWTVLIFLKRTILGHPHTRMGLMVARSYFVPLSVQTITPVTSMAIFWKVGPPHLEMFSSDMLEAMRRARVVGPIRSVLPRHSSMILSVRHAAHRFSSMRVAPMPASSGCAMCKQTKVAYWQVSQGCVQHDTIIDVPSRLPRTSSILRLMNIVAMTDPLELFRLIRGDHILYLCRLPELTRTYVSKYELPLSLDEYLMYVDNSCRQGETVDVVRSKILPWSLLIECG